MIVLLIFAGLIILGASLLEWIGDKVGHYNRGPSPLYDLIHSVKVYEGDCIEVQFAFQDWVEKAVISSETTNN